MIEDHRGSHAERRLAVQEGNVMGTLRNWMVMVPTVFVILCAAFLAIFVGIALAGGAPLAPWSW